MLVIIMILLAVAIWYWWWTAKTEKGRAFLAEVREKQRQQQALKDARKQNRDLANRTIPPATPPPQSAYFQSSDYHHTRANFNDVSNDFTAYPMTHHMKYMNREGGYSERDIGVVRSYRKSKRWYIDAYCYKRHEVRTFAVENILELEDLMAGNIYTQPNLIRESLKEFEE